jgi:hypothetical protein
MLSPKQIFLETIKKGGKPDRIVKQFEAQSFYPVTGGAVCPRPEYAGMPDMQDKWGTTKPGRKTYPLPCLM